MEIKEVTNLAEMYEPAQKKRVLFIISGLIISLLTGMVIIARKINLGNLDFNEVVSYFLVIRIVSALIIFIFSERIGRNSIFWMFFAFLFPGVALFLFGFLRKPLLPSKFEKFSSQEKSRFLDNIAARYIKMGFYKEGSLFVEKALEFNNQNYSAFTSRALINYYLKNYQLSLKDLNYSIENNPNSSRSYLIRGYVKNKMNDRMGAFNDWSIGSRMGSIGSKKALKLYCRNVSKNQDSTNTDIKFNSYTIR